MPEISVIIPTYEHANTLPKCLDAIFAQTFKDIEVIVVDDGSTDDTAGVIKPYLNRIQYKKIAHAGAPVARNIGFKLSSGHFVIFCDADLTMQPEMLTKLRRALDGHPDAAYAYAGFKFGAKTFHPVPFDGHRLRTTNYIHTTSLIRRAAFPGFDEVLTKFQDWDLWLTMSEQHRPGVAVPEVLCSIEPRRSGMSFWVPKFFYWPLWSMLGVRFKSVTRYEKARTIIAAKHHLPPQTVTDTRKLWYAFIAIFALSAIAYRFPIIGTVATIIMALVAVVVSSRRLIYGVALMLAELIFGSLGGAALTIQAAGHTVPLRIALFVAVAAVWTVRMAQRRVKTPEKALVMAVLALLAVVGWAVANGLLHGIPWRDVYTDANAYLALPMILFFASAVENSDDQKRLRIVLRNGGFALLVFSMLALYLFSHGFSDYWTLAAYKWLRDSRIAEITALPGGLFRFFMQSTIIIVIGLCMTLYRFLQERNRIWLFGIVSAAVLVISLSRSFALGLAGAIVCLIIVLIGSRRVELVGRAALRASVVLIGGVALFFLVLKFPLPASRTQESFQQLLNSRGGATREAASASRWALLPKLNEKIVAELEALPADDE